MINFEADAPRPTHANRTANITSGNMFSRLAEQFSEGGVFPHDSFGIDDLRPLVRDWYVRHWGRTASIRILGYHRIAMTPRRWGDDWRGGQLLLMFMDVEAEVAIEMTRRFPDQDANQARSKLTILLAE